jgi:hypothetical protein
LNSSGIHKLCFLVLRELIIISFAILHECINILLWNI